MRGARAWKAPTGDAVTLHLVRDEPPKPKRRKGERARLLSPDEERRFRAAMRGLHDAFGSWPCLAKAMLIGKDAIGQLMSGRRNVSGDMIVRAMRASGLSYADLMGGLVPADRCRACGKARAA